MPIDYLGNDSAIVSEAMCKSEFLVSCINCWFSFRTPKPLLSSLCNG